MKRSKDKDDLDRDVIFTARNRKEFKQCYNANRNHAIEPNWTLPEFKELFNGHKKWITSCNAGFFNSVHGWRLVQGLCTVGTASWLFMGRKRAENVVTVKGKFVILKRQLNLSLFDDGFPLLAERLHRDPDDLRSQFAAPFYGAYHRDNFGLFFGCVTSLEECREYVKHGWQEDPGGAVLANEILRDE